MFLVDTNVWLELLLFRQHANEVRNFFQATDASQLAITEFSLYSLGVILTRLKKAEVFEEFLSDVIEDSGVTRIRLTANELKQVIAVSGNFGWTLMTPISMSLPLTTAIPSLALTKTLIVQELNGKLQNRFCRN